MRLLDDRLRGPLVAVTAVALDVWESSYAWPSVTAGPAEPARGGSDQVNDGRLVPDSELDEHTQVLVQETNSRLLGGQTRTQWIR